MNPNQNSTDDERQTPSVRPAGGLGIQPIDEERIRAEMIAEAAAVDAQAPHSDESPVPVVPNQPFATVPESTSHSFVPPSNTLGEMTEVRQLSWWKILIGGAVLALVAAIGVKYILQLSGLLIYNYNVSVGVPGTLSYVLHFLQMVVLPGVAGLVAAYVGSLLLKKASVIRPFWTSVAILAVGNALYKIVYAVGLIHSPDAWAWSFSSSTGLTRLFIVLIAGAAAAALVAVVGRFFDRRSMVINATWAIVLLIIVLSVLGVIIQQTRQMAFHFSPRYASDKSDDIQDSSVDKNDAQPLMPLNTNFPGYDSGVLTECVKGISLVNLSQSCRLRCVQRISGACVDIGIESSLYYEQHAAYLFDPQTQTCDIAGMSRVASEVEYLSAETGTPNLPAVQPVDCSEMTTPNGQQVFIDKPALNQNALYSSQYYFIRSGSLVTLDLAISDQYHPTFEDMTIAQNDLLQFIDTFQ